MQFSTDAIVYRIICSYCPEEPNEATGEATITLEDGSTFHPPICLECARRLGARGLDES